jgi:excisionase family DNA binding protein
MSDRLLRVDEVATRLALKPATIRKLLYQRKLPRVKLGRAVRIREADLEAIIRLGYEPAQRYDTSGAKATLAIDVPGGQE